MKKYFPLLIIIGIGTILRLWGLNFGLPYQFHQDEPIIVNHALAYGTGDLNPHFFIIPPIASYILFGCYIIYFLAGSACGIFKGAESFALSFFNDPTIFYIIGRVVLGTLPGILCIYLTYRLAARLFSNRVAIYAAFVMALAFLNVVNAHYAYTDNLLALFILAAYLQLERLISDPRRMNYIIAGVLIGIATATKYNAVLLGAPFLAAHFIRRRAPERASSAVPDLALFAAAAIATFIICNPYSVLDSRFFLESLTHRIRGGYRGLSYHLTYSLFEGLGVIPTILGVAGLVWFLKKDFKKAVFLLSFPAFFYIHLVFKSQPFPRYALPIIPFLAIGLSFLLFGSYEKIRTKALKAAIVAASLALIIPTTAKSIKADLLFTSKDTRIEAKEWIEKNIEAGTRIALAHTFFSPPLQQITEQLIEKEGIVSGQPELKELKRRKLELLIKGRKAPKTYRVYYLRGDNEAPGQFLNLWPMVENSMDDIKKNDIGYIVFNNMDPSEAIKGLHDEADGILKVVAVFSPYKDDKFRLPYDTTELTCVPAGTRELFSRRAAGPYLVIYSAR
ncbi:MAG: glycosyltransferase family 39 protein [Candidatus Omnitrophota bacterium]|nr:glycosyltransferase family 39 protein [Candidatus Omnitrophota bacterium]